MIENIENSNSPEDIYKVLISFIDLLNLDKSKVFDPCDLLMSFDLKKLRNDGNENWKSFHACAKSKLGDNVRDFSREKSPAI